MEVPKAAWLLSDLDVTRKLGLKSRATVWRHVQSGILPRPIKIGRSSRFIGEKAQEVVRGAMADRDREASS